MNITLITDLYPVREDEKTTPRTLFDFVQGWKALGHNVSVIKPNFIFNSFVRQKPFYKTGKYGDVYNKNYWLPFVGNIKKNFSDLKKSLIIAHMPSGILFADKLGLPFVAGIHQSDIDVLTKPLYRFYFGKRLLKALKNSNAIACRSEILKKKLLNLYPQFKDKTFTCPSGIDENIIVKRDLNFSNKIKIITVANLKKRKNVDKIIEAIKGLENIDLTVIGDGAELKCLKKLAQGYKNISFLGALSNDEVLAKMRESDIFVLTSVNETFGMVYLEAMASGCIPVGTIDDGVDGIIENGQNGFLIKPLASEIRKTILNIKKMDKESLKTLQENSFSTIQNYTTIKCCNEYMQQILRFCKDLTH